jgi:hypothetical protein
VLSPAVTHVKAVRLLRGARHAADNARSSRWASRVAALSWADERSRMRGSFDSLVMSSTITAVVPSTVGWPIDVRPPSGLTAVPLLSEAVEPGTPG